LAGEAQSVWKAPLALSEWIAAEQVPRPLPRLSPFALLHPALVVTSIDRAIIGTAQRMQSAFAA
jgi:hypothetical protein